jgi:mRNA-degrading endonuclease RelE of RelBE toxin-antitoxin system
VSYAVFIEPEVHASRQALPGHVRQRVRRIIEDLAIDPHPDNSVALDASGVQLPPAVEIYRIRLLGWRIVYAVSEVERWVWILGIYRRPPYDYGDLEALAARIQL